MITNVVKAITTNPRPLNSAIIIQAINDWRMLINLGIDRTNSSPIVSFVELRNFFQGDFCQKLMATMVSTPEEILVQLERELAAAETNKPLKDVKP